MADEPCDACGSTEPMLVDVTVSIAGLLDGTMHRCRSCGLSQVRPRLTRQDLAALYPDDYFDSGSAMGFADYARQQQRAERDAYFLAKVVRRVVAPPGRILEVGCALGFLLEALSRFTGCCVRGVDVSAFAAYFARRRYGLDVTCQTLEEAAFPDGAFDFVVQQDVVEHVLRPRDHLVETARVLRPGGHLFVAIPNGDAHLGPARRMAPGLAREQPGLLPLIDQGHLSFFTKAAFLQLAAGCGLECVEYRTFDITGGLRGLGLLPGRRRQLERTAPRVGPRRAPPAAAPAASASDDEARARLYEKVSGEVERRRKPLRSSWPYFYFRHLLRAMNSLPAPFTCGASFQFLLRKRS